jgi:hypothetical protein
MHALAVRPGVGASATTASIMMRRRCLSPAGDSARLRLFWMAMMVSACSSLRKRRTDILSFGPRQFVRQRIAHSELGASLDQCTCTKCASVAKPTPIAEISRIADEKLRSHLRHTMSRLMMFIEDDLKRWLAREASGHPPIPDIASIIQDAATRPRARAPSSIWPRRWSFEIARRLEGHRTGGPIRGTCAATGHAERGD